VSSPGGSDFEARVADWLDVDAARRRIMAAARPNPAEPVELRQALGRALAEDIVAEATLPPWDNSAMDGYAVRSADIAEATPENPAQLPVTDVIRAGDGAPRTLQPASAMRIMTGAPVPDGADTVVRVEGVVSINSSRDSGRHVRGAGQDMRSGDLLFSPGHTITPGTMGVLAAAGRVRAQLHGVPTVAVLSTGDELRRTDQYDDVRKGQGVPESNGPMVQALVEALGAIPVDLGIAVDEPASIENAIERSRDSDVLITIGGASMGEADLVKRVLDTRGFIQDFWRVKMRPGSPISFGWLDHGDHRQAVFSLPGNPSSAFVTFEVFSILPHP
jgi:molybdopterin molybdotransferase